MPFSRRFRLLAVLLISFSLPVAAAPVAASLRPIALLVDQITAGSPTAQVLPSAERSAHHPIYRPSDRRLAVQARPLFWLGGELQPALARMLAALAQPDTVALLDGNADATIEHPWLDLQLAARMGGTIASALANRYPARGNEFKRRAIALDRSFAALVKHYQARFATLSSRDYIAEHDAFSPLDALFDLHLLGALIEADGDRAGARSLWQLQRRIAGRPAVCLVKVARSDMSLQDVIDYRGHLVVVTIDPLGVDVPTGPDAFYRFADGVFAKLYRCMAEVAGSSS